MTTWNNQTKNTSAYSNQSKSDPLLSQEFLLIDDTYFLLIDATYKLEIQSATSSTTWTPQTRN